MRWHFLFVLLTIFMVVGTAHSQEMEDTTLRLKAEAYRSYYGKGQPIDYARAYRLYLAAAERGDVEAQFIIGGMLYQGQGVEQDKRGGFKWLLQAAEQGKVSPESLNIIGGMYLRGEIVPLNYLEAKKWLTKAAEQGNLSAQNDLAYLLFNGLGGERDYEKALVLYEKAALQGDIMAQANTGLMYATGTGTDMDKARGYAWYSLSASQGNSFAIVNRNNLMIDMNWEELNRAQAISVELFHRVEKFGASKAKAGNGAGP